VAVVSALILAPLLVLGGVALLGNAGDTKSGSAGSTSTTTRRSTVTTATSRPTTTSIPTTTAVPTGVPPASPRTTPWYILATGDCLPTLPPDGAHMVPVVNCSQAHVAEVVGRATSMNADPAQVCTNSFQSFAGGSPEAKGAQISWLEALDPLSSITIICLAEPIGGGTMTGSFRNL
jgi:hypothetical protein